jgi:hypothetical protein
MLSARRSIGTAGAASARPAEVVAGPVRVGDRLELTVCAFERAQLIHASEGEEGTGLLGPRIRQPKNACDSRWVSVDAEVKTQPTFDVLRAVGLSAMTL